MANMKQNLTCNRSKPPPPRSSCYGLNRFHGPINLDKQTMQTQEGQRQTSNEKLGNFGDKSPSNAPLQKEVTECLSCWLSYLQMLNGLCGAGSRLSQTLTSLVQDTASPCHSLALQCHAAWEDLMKATGTASNAVKGHVMSALQDLGAEDSDADTNQVVFGILMTFMHLQQMFCQVFCDFLSSLCSIPCCETSHGRHEVDCSVGVLQHCFSRLYAAPRSPLPIPGPQRRWSEAAAAEMTGAQGDGTVRRWSMPWENSQHSRLHPCRLSVPPADRSRSNTPDSVWHSSLASQEELQEVIQLLSCRPGLGQSTQLHHPNQLVPGVTLTSCSYDGPSPEMVPWVEERRASVPPRHGSGSPQPSGHSTLHRASWHAPDPNAYLWTERENHLASSSSGADLCPPALASRKSSSSTDSSSSHSLHSRSTTGSGSDGGAEVRSHLYSMWSGSDLSFMKVPESSEPPEGNSPEEGQPSTTK